MPSNALKTFENHLVKDVDKLIASHAELNHEGGGRRGLGHITRSGVVMLCAAWEVYIEDVLVESVQYMVNNTASAQALPKDVKKSLAGYTKASKHELRVIDIADLGWKTVLVEIANHAVGRLNTPKSENIDPLFKKHLGFRGFSAKWGRPATDIDDFVTTRCGIAHRGGGTPYVQIPTLRNYRSLVEQTVVDADNALADHLRDHTTTGRSPWQRRARP